ncbi:lambda-exonuclease family protein [Rothia sp. (in: high G+C Gram-positive bacteria)]|uniref:lambda-exonuclease family protein n=1 Tax=Rothia sp. (in: high G+C Gram-positive bacteria) TaxID=1885016 RepID=UPI001CB44AB8|nr:YqaJ viral recombinase family protein [Rothia sp. (in: high G+C Gram-positive bacteria)]MBF1656133.1 YqaJ viral recombinase family protein [Rothia sp. (in: high G+C Gram-positive bacteria)]
MKINTLMSRATPAPAPGSDEWKQKITASKVASVVCKSPWTSKFALHAEMTGRYESDPINPAVLEAGNLLEPAVAGWYALHNPGVEVRECKKRNTPVWWVARDSEDFAATPDRILVDKETGEVTALLEIKTARVASEWGEEGTDEIPEHYKLQALWQMKCTGVKTVIFAVLHAGLRFATYRVDWDHADVAWLTAEAEVFMKSVRTGKTPDYKEEPGAFSTYEVLRYYFPECNGEAVMLSDDLVYRTRRAKRLKRLAARAEDIVKTELTAVMGNASAGVDYANRTVARRSQRKTPKGFSRPWVNMV